MGGRRERPGGTERVNRKKAAVVWRGGGARTPFRHFSTSLSSVRNRTNATHLFSPLPPRPLFRVLFKAERKKRRVSFRKGFKLQGATGWDRVELPGERTPSPTKKTQNVTPKKKATPKKVVVVAKKVKKEVKVIQRAKKVTPKKLEAKKVKAVVAKKEVVAKKAAAKVSKKVTVAIKQPVSPKMSPPKAARPWSSPMKSPKIKLESQRRGLRRINKKGFYNEKRLAEICWKGTGEKSSPLEVH